MRNVTLDESNSSVSDEVSDEDPESDSEDVSTFV